MFSKFSVLPNMSSNPMATSSPVRASRLPLRPLQHPQLSGLDVLVVIGLAPLQGVEGELLVHPRTDAGPGDEVWPPELPLDICVVNLSFHLGLGVSVYISCRSESSNIS